jgi:hypothetical protein
MDIETCYTNDLPKPEKKKFEFPPVNKVLMIPRQTMFHMSVPDKPTTTLDTRKRGRKL